ELLDGVAVLGARGAHVNGLAVAERDVALVQGRHVAPRATTITGQLARSMTSEQTLPSRARRTVPRPCDPITRTSSSPLAAARATAGRPSTNRASASGSSRATFSRRRR